MQRRRRQVIVASTQLLSMGFRRWRRESSLININQQHKLSVLLLHLQKYSLAVAACYLRRWVAKIHRMRWVQYCLKGLLSRIKRSIIRNAWTTLQQHTLGLKLAHMKRERIVRAVVRGFTHTRNIAIRWAWGRWNAMVLMRGKLFSMLPEFQQRMKSIICRQWFHRWQRITKQQGLLSLQVCCFYLRAWQQYLIVERKRANALENLVKKLPLRSKKRVFDQWRSMAGVVTRRLVVVRRFMTRAGHIRDVAMRSSFSRWCRNVHVTVRVTNGQIDRRTIR